VADEAAAEVEATDDQKPETLAEINQTESEIEIETSKTNSMNNIIKNILAALVCMFIGYAICYYFRPFELPTLSPATQTEKNEAPTDDEQAKDAAATEQTEATAEPQAAKPAPQVKNDYPQIEGGEYMIVGVLANDTMKAGKMLTKMAIQYYGNKDLYTYICKMNNIENPDIVPLNMPLVIPKLEKKQ
jgi:ATP-dependent Clp protease ATP-binding subunit ClpA